MAPRRNNKLLTEYVTFLEKLRAKNKDRLHEAAFLWSKLANDRSSELSKHLFTIASLVLPLSLIPVTNAEITASLSLESKTFLALSWGFFVLSLVAGVIHLRKEATFFNNWAKQENERSLAYGDAIFTTNPVDAYNRLEKMNAKAAKLVTMPSHSNLTFLHWQQGLLVAGVAMVGIVLFLTLFQPLSSPDRSKRHYQGERKTERGFYTPGYIKR